MSGNGAQGTKFRISVCTGKKVLEDESKLKEESLDKFNIQGMAIKKVNSDSKQNFCVVYNDVLARQCMEKEQILNQSEYIRNLKLQLRYLKLIKTNHKVKSYKKRNSTRLLMLIELDNEEGVPEFDRCNIKNSQLVRRKHYGSEIILGSLLQKDKKMTKGTKGKKRNLEDIDAIKNCESQSDKNKKLKVIVNKVTIGSNLNHNWLSN